jgi:hypothetical protein
METITSKERFTEPEATALRLDEMLKTTATTLGQVQADRDRLSERESSIIKREAEIGRREATINERDKEIEQRLGKSPRELADSRVQRLQESQAGKTVIQPEDQEIGRLMQLFPGIYRLGDLPSRSYIALHNGERIEGPEFQFHVSRAFEDLEDLEGAHSAWSEHVLGTSEAERENQEMYASMQEYLEEKLENSEDALHKFIGGSLDLITLRKVAYLLNPEEGFINPYGNQFMIKYRQNRDVRFSELESSEPPPIDTMKTMNLSIDLLMILDQLSGVTKGLSGKEVRFENMPKHKRKLFVGLKTRKQISDHNTCLDKYQKDMINLIKFMATKRSCLS